MNSILKAALTTVSEAIASSLVREVESRIRQADAKKFAEKMQTILLEVAASAMAFDQRWKEIEKRLDMMEKNARP